MAQTRETALPPLGKDGDLPLGIYRATLPETLRRFGKGSRQRFAVAQAHFGASVFWLRRLAALGGEEQAIAGWQIKRDGTCRGIIEIVEEQT